MRWLQRCFFSPVIKIGSSTNQSLAHLQMRRPIYDLRSALPYTFHVFDNGIKEFEVHALPVSVTDTPESFGYSDTDFGFASMQMIKVHMKMIVGTLIYDSLPGTLIVKSTDDPNNQWTRTIDLAPGMNTVRLPQSHKTYQFDVDKWNTQLSKAVNIENAPGNMTVTLRRRDLRV